MAVEVAVDGGSGAAVPFQEVISEATAAVEAEGRGAAPISPPKEIRSSTSLRSKVLVYFWICLLHGKVSLIGKKKLQFHSGQTGARDA